MQISFSISITVGEFIGIILAVLAVIVIIVVIVVLVRKRRARGVYHQI